MAGGGSGNVEVNIDVRELRDVVDELRTLNKNLEKISKSLESLSSEQKKENNPNSKNTMSHKLVDAVEKLTEVIKNKA